MVDFENDLSEKMSQAIAASYFAEQDPEEMRKSWGYSDIGEKIARLIENKSFEKAAEEANSEIFGPIIIQETIRNGFFISENLVKISEKVNEENDSTEFTQTLIGMLVMLAELSKHAEKGETQGIVEKFLDSLLKGITEVSLKAPTIPKMFDNWKKNIEEGIKQDKSPFNIPSDKDKSTHTEGRVIVNTVMHFFIKNLREKYQLKNQKEIEIIMRNIKNKDEDTYPLGIHKGYEELFGQLKIAYSEISEKKY